MKYIIDSNIFVQSKNFEYSFQYCQIFWDMILSCAQQNMICSIKSVHQELNQKNDELKNWLDDVLLPACPDFFENNFTSMSSYAQVLNWSTNHSKYTVAAKKEFAEYSRADAHIVAHALENSYGIITAEKQDNATKRIKIPNVAHEFNIQTLTLFDFLKLHAKNNFSL